MSLIFFKNAAQSVQVLQIVKSININLSDYHTIFDQARKGVDRKYITSYIISDDQKIIIIRQIFIKIFPIIVVKDDVVYNIVLSIQGKFPTVLKLM